LAEGLAAEPAERVAYRDQRRYVYAVEPVSVSERQETPLFKDGGVYLLIGGLGGLGFKIAELMTQQVQARLMLLGSSSINAAKQQQIDRLEASGSEVLYLQTDITNAAQTKEALRIAKRRQPDTNGVIQAGGILEDKLMVSKEWSSFRRVLDPKIRGTWIVNHVTQHEPLDFFVTFSSVVAITGNIGQSDYAAANSFLDAFMHYRACNDYPGKSVSINWTLWADGGMGQDPAVIEAFSRKTGVISGKAGLRAFSQLLNENVCQAIVTGHTWSAAGTEHADTQPVGVSRPLEPAAPLREPETLPPSPPQTSSAHSQTPPDNTVMLPRIEQELTALIAQKIQSSPDQILPDDSFFDIGVESVVLQEIMADLEKRYGHLSPTLLFEYSNIRDLAAFLVEKLPEEATADLKELTPQPPLLQKEGEPERKAATLPFLPLSSQERGPGGEFANGNFQPKSTVLPDTTPHETATKEIVSHAPQEQQTIPAPPTITPPVSVQPSPIPRQQASSREAGYQIAVIGMSGRFPQAPNLDVYWQNLASGKDCIEEIPADRWNHHPFFDRTPDTPDKTYGKWGGFLEDVDKFDPLFFNISPREAEQMDPQQRLFLECAWETMEHAGYGNRKQYKGKRIGVYVGVMWNEYSQISNQEGFLQQRYVGPGSLYWAIANRVSYVMDFKGPSLAIDTACSSSLTTVHLACQSILNGESEMALAGGVNLSLHPYKYLYLGQARFLSHDGRCRSFGQDGSGYVPGEGVGAVLLKPLEKAIQDGDR
ncbi:MAG: SDR family NAD(P)-dependent oxidoreductase, partial [Rhodobacteraceae bacterium]|nr:SDR family NAD(P)-dependent oxidoreductase [Paracoccaceae bacterium]